ncbi:MAG: dicarboxylate/amino acid:cation symporter [Treponemataceae bacterium]
MKIWLKYLGACILGVAVALLNPFITGKNITFFDFLFNYSLNIGRYMVIPTIFFCMSIGIYNLRVSRKLFKTALYCIAIIVPTTIFLTLFGTFSVSIIKFPRVAISVEEITHVETLNIIENLLKIFPSNPFAIFLESDFLLPLCMLAGFVGAALASDKTVAKFAINVFDSLSSVFYAILSFFIDIFAFFLIAISAYWTISYFDVLKTGTYNFLFILLFINMIVIICVIYPLILKFAFNERRPYRVLYASTAGLIVAFFTSDTNIALGVNLRHTRASLGIQHRVDSVSLPVFSIFSRGGTAMAVAISFIIILKSYSRQTISLYDILWIVCSTSVISFLLGAFSVNGSFIALTVLCTLYGNGFESGYLILKPVAFFIGSVATTIDVATSIFGSYIIANKQKHIQRKDIRFFV